jgi:hypothetical protein
MALYAQPHPASISFPDKRICDISGNFQFTNGKIAAYFSAVQASDYSLIFTVSSSDMPQNTAVTMAGKWKCTTIDDLTFFGKGKNADTGFAVTVSAVYQQDQNQFFVTVVTIAPDGTQKNFPGVLLPNDSARGLVFNYMNTVDGKLQYSGAAPHWTFAPAVLKPLKETGPAKISLSAVFAKLSVPGVMTAGPIFTPTATKTALLKLRYLKLRILASEMVVNF